MHLDKISSWEEKDIYPIKRFGVGVAEYFYDSCQILTSPQRVSKYKQRVKVLSDNPHQNI